MDLSSLATLQLWILRHLMTLHVLRHHLILLMSLHHGSHLLVVDPLAGRLLTITSLVIHFNDGQVALSHLRPILVVLDLVLSLLL